METSTTAANVRLLRLPEVMQRVGLEKSAIYQGMKEGKFPQCIKLGWRATVWSSSEIDAWIDAHIRVGKRGVR